MSINRLSVVAALAVLGVPSPGARQEAATVTQVIEKVRSLRRSIDVRTEGRIVRLDAAGRRTTWQFAAKARAFPDTVKVLWEVTGPPPDRLRLLIEAPETGRLRMQVVRERDRAVEDLTPERMGDALLESSLAYEDLADAHFSWRDQRLTGDEPCGDRRCYVIRSQPDPDAGSHYAAVTSWIDRNIYVPIIVRKRVKGSAVVKTFTYRGLRQSNGQWGARQVDVRIEGSPLRTLLVVTRGSGKANLGADDFAPAVLVSAWR